MTDEQGPTPRTASATIVISDEVIARVVEKTVAPLRAEIQEIGALREQLRIAERRLAERDIVTDELKAKIRQMHAERPRVIATSITEGQQRHIDNRIQHARREILSLWEQYIRQWADDIQDENRVGNAQAGILRNLADLMTGQIATVVDPRPPSS